MENNYTLPPISRTCPGCGSTAIYFHGSIAEDPYEKGNTIVTFTAKCCSPLGSAQCLHIHTKETVKK